MEKIKKYREEIDELEKNLLTILNRRAELAFLIGDEKKKLNLPIFDQEREDKILERVEKNNPGPFSSQAVRRIFIQIIEESKKIQNKN